MKFGMRIFLYKMLSSENGYGEHGISDRHNLHKGVNEYIPYNFHISSLIYLEVHVELPTNTAE